MTFMTMSWHQPSPSHHRASGTRILGGRKTQQQSHSYSHQSLCFVGTCQRNQSLNKPLLEIKAIRKELILIWNIIRLKHQRGKIKYLVTNPHDNKPIFVWWSCELSGIVECTTRGQSGGKWEGNSQVFVINASQNCWAYNEIMSLFYWSCASKDS